MVAMVVGGVNVFSRAMHAARGATCRANLNQVSTALLMYCADYDERLPPAGTWSNNLYPYTKNWAVFRCTERGALPGGFAFNEAVSRRKQKDLNHEALTPAIFESSLGVLNASDRLRSFVTPHGGFGYVIFANGQVQRLSVAPSATAGIIESERGQPHARDSGVAEAAQNNVSSHPDTRRDLGDPPGRQRHLPDDAL